MTADSLNNRCNRPGVAGFVLAAGEGRRLRPATFVRPKALAPFCGTPLLELAVRQIAPHVSCGVVVNACYLADQVEDAARQLADDVGVPITVSREARLLDTGGGLRKGVALLPDDAEHILVHNVDVLLDFDLGQLLDFHFSNQALVTLVLIPDKGPCTVDLGYDLRIADLRRARGEGRYTYAGVHVFRRDLLDFLPDAEVCSIVDAWEAALAQGERVLGLAVSARTFWTDVGTPRTYILAHGEAADRGLRRHPALQSAQQVQAERRAALEQAGVRVTGACGIGRDVQVPPGAHLHNVVLWDGVRLEEPALYADTIFTGGTIPPPPPINEKRRPDPRVWTCLDLPEKEPRILPVRKQGSGRLYKRLACGDRRYVWCAYDRRRQENAAFAALADFLDRIGVRAPAVELHLGDVGEVVLQDLGKNDLQHETDGARIEVFLDDVVRQIARLHVLGDRAVRLEEFPLQRGFTRGLYDWERDYFRTHVLERLLGRSGLWADVADEYCEVRTLLLEQPTVPIHRDLQSANIMIHDGVPWLIDFQGMRYGCAAYDLASLLYDPYMCHPVDRRRRVWRKYCRYVRDLGGTPPNDEVLFAAALQRLMQALGAYAKLWLQDGLEWYRRFIVPGFRMMETAAMEGERKGFRNLARTCRGLAEARTSGGGES